MVLADRAALAIGDFPDDTSLVVADIAVSGLSEHDPSLLGEQLSQLVAH